MLWDILMKLFMSLNKSSIHPSLNYLSKMNAPCISFHSSAFRAALREELWNNPTRTETHTVSTRHNNNNNNQASFSALTTSDLHVVH